MRLICLGIFCILINLSTVSAGSDGMSGNSSNANYENAIKSLKEGVLKNSEDIILRQTLAQLYVVNGNYDQAIVEAKWILKKDSKSMSALNILSTCYFFKHDYDESIEAGYRMLAIDNKIPGVYAMIGQNYKLKGEYEKAIDYFSKAISLAPTDMVARNNLSNLYLTVNNLTYALSLTLDSEKIDPQNSHTLYELARIYARKGDSVNAINALRKAIGINAGLKEEAKAADDFSQLHKMKEFQELLYK